MDEEKHEQLKAKLSQAVAQAKEQGQAKTLSASEADLGLTEYLVESDRQLKAIIQYFKPPHTRPDPQDDEGSPEFGILPFWIKYPDEIPDHDDPLITMIFDQLSPLQEFGIIPQPTITRDDYAILTAAIADGRAIASDGTMYGFGPFQQLNPRWMEAVANTLLTKVYGKNDFGTNSPLNGNLPPAKDGPIKIAILGDWGTGAQDALDVMSSAMDLKPDYLIHLGDVYYTGTPPFSFTEMYFGEDNEQEHLVDNWPSAQAPGTSFTMNSNHEMYCGARGLFKVALEADAFKHQNGKSYFLIQNEAWQIFGLDSAYTSPDFLYFKGALNNEQIEFIQANVDRSKKILFLTHHNAYTPDGQDIVYNDKDNTTGLLLDALKALNPDSVPEDERIGPDYWYWGHVHDGIVYAPKTIGGKTCFMRCCGHASMPFGAPWGLTKEGSQPPFTPDDFLPTVDFFAQTPMTSDPAGQVRNGFAMITLDGDSISEAFYDNDGNRTWPSD